MRKERFIVSLIIVLLVLGACMPITQPEDGEKTAVSPSATAAISVTKTAVSPTPQLTFNVTRVIGTAEPSPTPAACTSLPEGMTFNVEPVSNSTVMLELTGLQSGEELHLIYMQKDRPLSGGRFEKTSTLPIKEDGRYTTTQLLQDPNDSFRTWQITVIHARGVACTEVTFPPAPPSPPQIYCLDPQIDKTVGILENDGRVFTYTNPILGIELTTTNAPCVHEPDYLADSYGFGLSNPDIGNAIVNINWLYQAAPDQLETIVQQTIKKYPQLDVTHETVTVNGIEGIALWPLPGMEATTQIYLVANERLYHLIFWSAPLDEQAQAILENLSFIEPTQTLDMLNLSEARP